MDASGQPKIIDFGVARATDSDMVLPTLQTSVGDLVGTIQYMSPEQCEADPHDILFYFCLRTHQTSIRSKETLQS